MLRGIYTAAAGMISNMVSTDTVANNLANVATAGFKRNAVNFQAFPELLMRRMMAGQDNPRIGSFSTGTRVHGTATMFHQGGVQSTGNPLDMAIKGDGFFTLQDNEGNEYFTRNGNFTLDSDGYLTTPDGKYVQGQGGNIRIPSGAQITVNEQGDVFANGTRIDRLQVTQFEDNNTLDKIGDSLFKAGENSQEATPGPGRATFTVMNGALEGSNVSVIGEMVQSITGMRLYESLQRNIRTQDSTLEKLINGVG